MSRTLGEAIIAILPDTGAFKKLLQAKLKEAMAGVNADVPISADTKKLDAAIASSKAKIADFQAKAKNTELGASSKGLDKAVAKATAEVADLQSKTGSLKLDANDKAITAKITDLEAKSKHLQDGLGNLKSDVDIRAALAKIQSFQAQIKVLKSEASDIALKSNDAALKKQLDEAMARLAVLKDDAQHIRLDANADKLNAQIKLEEVKIAELTRKRDLKIKVDLDDKEALAKAGFLKTLLSGGGSASGSGKNGVGGLAGDVLQTALPGGGATTLPGVAGLGGIALGVLSTGFAGIVPLIASATGALGAFGVLAIPTIKGVVNGLTALTTATGTYTNASRALNAGIQSSPQNLAAYQKSLAGLSPQLAGAAELLTSQKTTWQNLTPAQRASEVALKNNAAAYKALLPAQKNALNALLQEGVAWNNMTPAQRAAATGIQSLEKEFSKLSNILAPITLKVLNAGLAVLNTLLPDLLPFAKVAGDALIKLLNSFEAFAKSAGFKAFQANMLKLAGPAILAIGTGFGKVAIALGKLLVAMESPDALVILAGLFRILADVIEGIAIAFKIMTPVMVNAFRIFNDLGKSGLDTIIGLFKIFGDVIQGHWRSAWNALTAIVRDWIGNIFDAFKSVNKMWDTLVPTKIRTEIANIFDGIRHDIAHIWDLIFNDTIGDVLRISHNVETQFDSLQHAVANIFDGIRHNTAIVWNDLYGATVGVAIRIGHDVETQFNNLKRGTASIFGSMGGFFATWWGNTEKFFVNAGGDIANFLSRVWDAIFGRVKNAWGSIGGFFATWWGNTEKFFMNVVGDIANFLSRIWDAIFGRIKNAWGSIGNFFATWWGNTKKFISNAVSDIANLLSRIWDAIFNRVKNAWGSIGNFFATWWGNTKKFFGNAVNDVKDTLSKGWDSVYNRVKSAFGGIGNFFATWWGNTEKFIGGAVDNISNKIAHVWSDIKDVTRILWNAIGNFMGAGIDAGKAALRTAVQGAELILKPLVTGYNAVRHIWNGAKVVWGALGFAQGGQVGKVMAGTGETADDVLIRVSKNETILSAAHSKILDKAGVLGQLGVPGYAKGGKIPGYQYGGDPGTPNSGDAPMSIRQMTRSQQAAAFRALGVTGYASGGTVTGPQIASDAERWQGHRYVWGGASNPQQGWDCSSFAGYILGHDFGFKLPGGVSWNPHVHGPTANMFTGQPGFGLVSHNINDIMAGDLLVENSGGHVGFGVGPNKMFSAYDTQSGTIFSNAANMTEILRIGKGVQLGPGARPGSGPGGGGGLSQADIDAFGKYMKLVNKDIGLYNPAAIARAVEKHPGPLPKGVLTPAGLANYNLTTGTVATGIKPAVQALFNQAQAEAAGPSGNGPLGVGGSAGEMANGRQLYNYLMKNLFGGHRIAAAGALASIWGESEWNPFAAGTGGRGLIGWTPASTISNADFKGGMATQLPALLRFVVNNGDLGTISKMFQAPDVLTAANEWGRGVERFGINDVHPTGLALAKQIAGLKMGGNVGSMVGKYDSGGWLPVGASVAVNNTGSPERVVGPNSMTSGERAILAELRAINHATTNAPARFGQAINRNLSRGAGRGYYGG